MKPLAIVLAIVLLAGPAHAQQRPQPARPTAPAPPAPEAPAPVYEPQLLKLAETLGALSFLATLCRTESGAPDAGNAWRQRMQELLEAEAASPGQQERLAGAFNRGHAGYATTYRICTPSGRAAIDRLLKDGQRIAKELSNRYGT